jgi:hypothetical protein
MIMLRRMRWRGYVGPVGMMTNALGSPPPPQKQKGRDQFEHHLWKHYVKMDLKAGKWAWINMAQDRYHWWTVVKMIMILWVSWKAVSFLTCWLHMLLKSKFFSFLPILTGLTWLSPSRCMNDCEEFIPCEYFGFYTIVNWENAILVVQDNLRLAFYKMKLPVRNFARTCW